MAFSKQVAARVIGAGDSPIWTVDGVSWWDTNRLQKDPRFTDVCTDGCYHDFIAVLSPAEALALHNAFVADAWGHHKPHAADLGAKLAALDPGTHEVVVTVYEWESGM